MSIVTGRRRHQILQPDSSKGDALLRFACEGQERRYFFTLA